ncbi:MAG TPA: methylated-DNA--[protein]-cysteine S-methyltransferase [Verrucomicrobiae bacterium]|nr:methylated-DNA--[protein]-cysteine S-methyltransferase [Verrucomicrobiae bacterium]HTZ54664.1 methylated-DNA--[protein]-cysteine S-methyltransferase [Candidatus Acidoferrum sp.]
MENFIEATYPRSGRPTPGALFRSLFASPFGVLNLGVDADGTLVELWLPNRERRDVSSEPFPAAARTAMDAVKTQLHEYFAGKRRTFDLAIAPKGSPFEQRVWTRLRTIPYGATMSYGAIAAEFGLDNAARAVGRANGANPIPIIIPCHRVIGADGTLTGFGGGLPLKRALLELEGAIRPPDPQLF